LAFPTCIREHEPYIKRSEDQIRGALRGVTLPFARRVFPETGAGAGGTGEGAMIFPDITLFILAVTVISVVIAALIHRRGSRHR
jgi:hypothetical protein